MAIDGNIDYALARVSARHGRRLNEGDWRRLEVNRDMSHYVAAVRSTALAGWVGAVEAEHDCHGIERALRVQWRRYVEGVAAWHPRAWQAWLAWLVWLPSLSLLAPLARPDPAPAWLLADPSYGPVAPGSPADRAAVLTRTPLAPLQPAVAGGTALLVAWSTEWHRLRPRVDGRTERSLRLLRQAVEQHEQAVFRAADSAEPPRQELGSRLQSLFRLAGGTVIVSVCHLALVALDLERLRGGLARRCLFGGADAGQR